MSKITQSAISRKPLNQKKTKKRCIRVTYFYTFVDTIDTVEGVCNGFLPYTRFLGFPEFSGYHQWQQESQ